MAAACNGVFPWEPDTLLAGSISASGRHMAVRIFFSAAAKPISAAKDSGVSLALLNQLAGRGSCSTVEPPREAARLRASSVGAAARVPVRRLRRRAPPAHFLAVTCKVRFYWQAPPPAAAAAASAITRYFMFPDIAAWYIVDVIGDCTTAAMLDFIASLASLISCMCDCFEDVCRLIYG
ncbi:hypothetical protein BHE74_00021112 [Ensete ventricosum]|nr:hypothetical protein BHE74_00021112 [Ensete ventricosum]